MLSVHGEALGTLRDALGAPLLGEDVYREFGGDLPFLLKVLSIHTALSIQVHPDKAQAAALHAARPDLYKDPNHKPELAVALTRFEGTQERQGWGGVRAGLGFGERRAGVGCGQGWGAMRAGLGVG